MTTTANDVARYTGPYTNFHVSPGAEVDYGVWWTHKGTQIHYRVSYIGDTRSVVAVGTDDSEIVLAEHVSFEVVERLLDRPYYSVGLGTDHSSGWATACHLQADIDWVRDRLAKWSGAEIWTYTGKDYAASEVKMARTYAKLNGFSGAGGGLIYDAAGRPFIQGWRSLYDLLVRRGRIIPIEVDPQRSHIVRRAIIQAAR